ncbi:putative ABC transport system ATP-binding protein [Paracoccus isoporae]|uniref:Putative ABC transport system ATP-binding protein n=1 Tax=Paracoccus isoporae TaxID=591205 RepID=A0A1G6SY97_9RHOB|nr:ATP-binding cassette domain-containing protein [Paracoccus isoporae]SDD21852.1 putative ABC transport system ATP-binding protein [Paracoccus isoporae]
MSLPLSISGLTVRAGARALLTIEELALPACSLTCIRGPSGAGKTTALHALAGLLSGTGRLAWGDADLCRMSRMARTRFRGAQMGMVFQDFLLFEELTARENALISAVFRPDRAALSRRADALMERLGLSGLAQRRADRLSGGERQRVAVVRALAHDPAILLADEPTASLDRATADALIADLAALARAEGRSVVIASHDPQVWDAMDRVLTIRDGVLEAG